MYAIIRGGIAAFAGDVAPPGENSTTQALSAFAIGALAGYGSHKVFIWLDKQVDKLLKAPSPDTEVEVPDLRGKTQEKAEKLLKEAELQLGNIDHKPTDNPSELNKIVDQDPSADSLVSKGTKVNVKMAVKGH